MRKIRGINQKQLNLSIYVVCQQQQNTQTRKHAGKATTMIG